MVKHLYNLVLTNQFTRVALRRAIRKLRAILGCPDAYADLLSVISSTSPSAILDIGSYVGDTVLRFLDETSVCVHAFEPTPSTFQKLVDRFDNCTQVNLHRLALGGEQGKQRFFLNKNAQTNSLLENDIGNVSSFGELTEHMDEATIDVWTLDQWMQVNNLSGPLVIKADIQGAEGMLLEGGQATFKDHVVAFFSEVQLEPMYESQKDFHTLNLELGKLGFYIANIYPCFHDKTGRAVQCDVLWLKEGITF